MNLLKSSMETSDKFGSLTLLFNYGHSAKFATRFKIKVTTDGVEAISDTVHFVDTYKNMDSCGSVDITNFDDEEKFLFFVEN
jgi:hypothetical protein